MPLIVDTLVIAQKLRSAGLLQEHAEAHADVARDVLLINVVSRDDLRAEIAQMRSDIKAFEEALVNRVWRTVATIMITALGVAGTLAAIIANSGKLFGK